MTTNLSRNVPGLNLTNWSWLLRTDPGETNLLVPYLWAEQAFFMLAQTNDLDGDGMSDAYERLVSHTNPTNADSPVITSQPLSQTVYSGDTVTFTVAAEGLQPLAYQWMLNGTNLAGATGRCLTISPVQMSHAGDYSVQVTSAAALAVLSSNATLAVEYMTYWPAILLEGPRQDYTFKKGLTYYVYTSVELYGETTIEGGSVIKFNWGSTDATLAVMGTLVCKTEDPYDPAFLTACDDDAVGEPMWPGFPPTWYNDCPYLDLTCAQGPNPSLSNLRIRFAGLGVAAPAAPRRLDIWDCQFLECNTAVVVAPGGTAAFHNVLLASCGTAVAACTNFAGIEGEHVTADVADFWAGGQPNRISLTNSIVVGGLATGPALIADHTALNPGPEVFQSVGYGSYYLNSASPYRTAGSGAVSTRLLEEFQHKSTQPPIALLHYSHMDGEMTLAPQAERYSNGAPDYGYYYPALDYTIAWLSTRGSVTVLPGTAIGFGNEYVADENAAYGGFWTWWGLDLREGSEFTSHGTPAKPNIFADVQLVQEQFANPCVALFVPDFWPNDAGSPPPSLDFRFSNFYASPAWFHVWAGYDDSYDALYSPDSLTDWTMRDCNLHGGRITLGQPDDGSAYGAPVDWVYGACAVSWNNNLFDNVTIILDPTFHEFGWDDLGLNCDMSLQAYNNLFRGGLWFHLEPIPASAGNWVFKDNLFESVDFVQDTNAPLDFNFNAYWPLSSPTLEWARWVANGARRLYPWSLPNASQLSPTAAGGGGNEQALPAPPAYQSGPLGAYYLPPSGTLFGGGSRTAADAALYHYTTRVDQKKEGDESSGHMVNIGLHYIAGTNGVPRDSDGDGIPDYVENWHGDGAYTNHADAETDWQTQCTVAGIYDPTNSVYDDTDLSGSGLVGRIKRALGQGPFDTANPLTLTQVITGEEPDYATFEVPVSYDAVAGSGALNVNMNGIDVSVEECTPATNGNCLLSFNVAFDPAGSHYLSAGFRLADEPPAELHPVMTAIGNIQSFVSSNSARFFENGSMFDDTSAYLDAKVFAPSADYIIRLYNPDTAPRTLLASITNSTMDGVIHEEWNLTCDDGSYYAGGSIEAEYDVAPDDSSGSYAAAFAGMSRKTLTRATNSLSEWGPNIDVAYFYTPTNTSLTSEFAKDGAIWNAMQGVVDALTMPAFGYDVYNSSFNHYTCYFCGPGEQPYPGYITSRSTVTDNLLPDLANGLTKQFYAYGHADGSHLGSCAGNDYISSYDVSGRLHNTYAKKGGLKAQNPFRFIFLDGCSTASAKDWRRAFGVYPSDVTNAVIRSKVGPQAYVGWADVHTGWLNARDDSVDSLNVARACAQTLANFYSEWMNGVPLVDCIYDATKSTYGAAPFPVPENKQMMIAGNGYMYWYTNVTTSKIYLIGFPGLKVNTTDHSYDQNTTYAAPKNVE